MSGLFVKAKLRLDLSLAGQRWVFFCLQEVSLCPTVSYDVTRLKEVEV